jgi:hypothetical protein
MSLHAQLLPETSQRLAARDRSTRISSFVIALMATALIGVVLFIIAIGFPEKEFPEIAFVKGILVDEPAPTPTKVPTSLRRKPTPPSAQPRNRVLISRTTSSVTIPEVMHVSTASALGMSDADDFGDSAGFTGNKYGGGILPPGVLNQRCNQADRLKRLEETGGIPACDESVLKALRWLKEKQHDDGSWDNKNEVAMTGLALLAYLGHCETPESPEFGETVLNATVFLIDTNMKNQGKMASDFNGHWCYEHAIATYALCECYTFSKSFGYNVPHLKTATQDAVQWILNNPNSIGGWNYKYDEKARFDTSINAWHLQALKAAQTTGLEFNNLNRGIKDALEAIAETQQKHGGFGYNMNGPVGSANGHFTLTGAGTLCLQQHKGVSNGDARRGIRYLSKNSRFNFDKSANLYEHYYSSQAMVNYGGEPWKNYNLLVRDELLKRQNSDGSWPNPERNEHQAGPIYNTCLATLMMEVYYRYLPSTERLVR